MALTKATQFAIAGVVVTAVAFLVLSSPDEGVLEYVYADKVVDTPSDYQGREFKVHGNVVEGTLRQAKGGDYHFVIESKGKRLKVVYDDHLPDTFAEGGEVVMTGHLDEEGVLRSSEMTAKCPSKYEEEPGAPAKS
ncbi:MAG: cytochrome c maturation protein CcmE [Myxococcales bacterium]|nr:cytochrome c maturation protein CcmE [Myxococcales bacterium]